MIPGLVKAHLAAFSSELRIAVEAVEMAGQFLRERQTINYPAPRHLPKEWILEWGGSALNPRARLKADRSIQLPEDCESQERILARITEAFPTDGIVAEETPVAPPRTSRVWLVDPLDGTRNYLAGLPEFAVSVALVVGGITMVGAISTEGHLAYAERGKGAYRTTEKGAVERMPVRSLPGAFEVLFVHQSLRALMNQPPLTQRLRSDPEWSQLIQLMDDQSVIPHALGSAVQHQYLMAAGVGTAYFNRTLPPWDAGAGSLLIEEAGGRVTNWKGDRRDPLSMDSYLATNGASHDYFLGLLASLLGYLNAAP